MGLAKNLRSQVNEPEGIRRHFYRLVRSNYFEYIITFFIVLNTAVMALKHHNMGEELVTLSQTANVVFSIVFNVEMALKLIGLGYEYFQSSWNLFDMFIVLMGDLGSILTFLEVNSGGLSTTITVIRGIRILRMFRLIKTSKSIRLILDTIMNILPQINTVFGLLLLLVFIYASLAINLFSGVMMQDSLDDKNNFRNFGTSMVTLMRFATGEDWHLFMYELANSEGYHGKECIEGQSYEDM